MHLPFLLVGEVYLHLCKELFKIACRLNYVIGLLYVEGGILLCSTLVKACGRKPRTYSLLHQTCSAFCSKDGGSLRRT